MPLEDLSVHLLQRAMQRLIEDQKRRRPRQVEPNPLSVLERMGEILDLLRSTWSLLFSSVAGPERIRAEWVVTLLALLELVRLGQARARQAELFGEIVIERNAVSVREPARAIEEPPSTSAAAAGRRTTSRVGRVPECLSPSTSSKPCSSPRTRPVEAAPHPGGARSRVARGAARELVEGLRGRLDAAGAGAAGDRGGRRIPPGDAARRSRRGS